LFLIVFSLRLSFTYTTHRVFFCLRHVYHSIAREFNEEIEKLNAKLKERAAARLASFRLKNTTSKSTASPIVVSASKPGGILGRAMGGKQAAANAAKLLDLNADINLLVEIVSCTDVPVADITSTVRSFLFFVCVEGGREVVMILWP
jgi:hypothetical protein